MLKSLFLVSLVILAASCIQSVKIPSFGGSDAGAQKPCARLSHPETGEQLELHSLREKKLLEAGWSGAFSSFTVMDGCQLSLWADPREWSESRSFPRGVYPNQLLSAVGSFSSYQCTCDDPIKNKNFRNFKRRHLASKNEQGPSNPDKGPSGSPNNTLHLPSVRTGPSDPSWGPSGSPNDIWHLTSQRTVPSDPSRGFKRIADQHLAPSQRALGPQRPSARSQWLAKRHLAPSQLAYEPQRPWTGCQQLTK
ncbi:UNVERIFIED_CONTAM: hypothetical protein FKN15_052653 [Acipenser sinensis]